MRRVVLIGPECSGKTTLAASLADTFDAPWTPEAARRFAETSTTPLSLQTVGPIAQLSIALENQAIAGARAAESAAHASAHASAPTLLIRDTDLVSTVVYSYHYYGVCEPWIEAAALERRADLYLLCAPDLPWTPDGIRDRPDAREALHAEFAERLDLMQATVVRISGLGAARETAAVVAVRELLRR
jgi:nicotinamide riboside kinase